MRAISTRWQPNPATHSPMGIRGAIGHVRRFRTPDGVRAVDGYGRGSAVLMGIRLKEGET